MIRTRETRFGIAVFALLLSAAGCSGDGEGGLSAGGGTSGVDAGSGGVGAGGSGGAGGFSGGAGGVAGTAGYTGKCSPLATPLEVPDGWQEWTEFSCACRFYRPGGSDAAPEPLEWEPCPSPGPKNSSCRRLKTPWTTKATISISPYLRYWRDPSTDVGYLALTKVFIEDRKDVFMNVVAPLDGLPSMALMHVGGECAMVAADLSGGNYAFKISGEGAGFVEGAREGVAAGSITGGYPATVINQEATVNLTTAWRTSSSSLLRWHSALYARPWDSDQEVLVYSAANDPEHMPEHNVLGRGDAVFFEVGVSGYSAVMSWTKDAGPQPLIRWPGDYTQGAGNFNTDGLDMVWTHGEGKPQSSQQQYPVRSVMTAPYTTDPAVREKTQKRLRSDPDQLNPYPYGIGCGYAARPVTRDDGVTLTRDLMVVRLSDGLSWFVEAPPVTDQLQSFFVRALGVTCDEVVAIFQFQDDAESIVRIPLDSLGPGTAPD